jgi:hypothetical protein
VAGSSKLPLQQPLRVGLRRPKLLQLLCRDFVAALGSRYYAPVVMIEPVIEALPTVLTGMGKEVFFGLF